MLTGYNTDVSHADRVFHVQTEDKGTSNPYIESLVYVGGQVVSSKRTDYGDRVEDGKEALIRLMETQHREMIAAIRAGDFDEKVLELLGPPKKRSSQQAKHPSSPAFPQIKVNADRSLDEVILEYLTNEAEQEHLVMLLEENVELAIGEATSLPVRASSSKTGRPIPGTEVVFKMISTVAEPKVLAKGTTDEDGLLEASVTIPDLREGRAALIITGSSGLGKASLKYPL